MKNLLFALLFLCSTAAFGQYYAGGSSRPTEPVILQSPSHPAQAGYAPMSSERNILGSGSYSSAQGDRPPSDFPQVGEISLGVAARELKKQHALVKKSKVVWVN